MPAPPISTLVRAARAVSAIALWLGLLGLPAVLCLMFPGPLSTESLREIYPMPLIRGLIQGGLIVGLVLALVGIGLPGRRARSCVALVLVLAAFALGGGYALPVEDTYDAPIIGLDFLLLDLFLLCLLFVPLERLLPRRRQKILRAGWNVDLLHFTTSHVLIGVIAALSVAPAQVLFGWLLDYPFRDWVGSLHVGIQFLLVVAAVDFTNYWVHRAFHKLPWLWRFHAVHHSVKEMDWLAGSRQHLGDIVITRAVGFVPVFVLGFADAAIYAYILLISFHAVFIHANVRIEFGPLARVLTSPKFHHWHHANTPDAVDVNFAVLLPIWDDLFGSSLWKREWPTGYGLVHGDMPETWLGQMLHPFKRRPKPAAEKTS
jgi:lathosterol oxidase